MGSGLAKLKLQKKDAIQRLSLLFLFPIELRAEANPPLCKRPEIKAGGSERRRKILCVSFGLSTIESEMIHTEQRQVAASLPCLL